MRAIILIFTCFLMLNCSFDNKTGIWNNIEENIKREERFADFEKLYTEEKTFKSILKPKENLNIIVNPPKINNFWLDEFYQDTNNLENYKFANSNQTILKSKKLSRNNLKNKILFDGNYSVFTDEKGSIIIYSVKDKEITLKYNFYKKKFKKIKKVLNIIINNKILYVGDNLGYLYSLNYLTGELIWAKNYKIPFRSNIKVLNEKIIITDINNTLYFIDKKNGEKLKTIPSEIVTVKNNFVNSLATYNETVFFLNTYGSLYSINNKGRINWFINMKDSFDKNYGDIFFSNPLAISGNKIVVSTDPYLYILNSDSGSTISKTSITSIFKPILTKNNIFLITKDNLLVCLDFNSGKPIYSLNIGEEIANYLNNKKKFINVKYFSILNGNLFVFLSNSYFVEFSVAGKIINVGKLPKKIESLPIFAENTIIYTNKKNQLIISN